MAPEAQKMFNSMLSIYGGEFKNGILTLGDNADIQRIITSIA